MGKDKAEPTKDTTETPEVAAQRLARENLALQAERVSMTAELERLALNYRNFELANARPYVDGATLARALSKAQGMITNIGKDKEVDFPTKQGGKVTFRYATLAACMAVVRKPLSDNGLSLTQFPTFDFSGGANSTISVRTRLTHDCGEFIENTITLPCLDRKPSDIGIIISYARRYGVTSLLGLAQTDETNLEELEGADQRFAGMEAPPPLEDARAPSSTTRPNPSPPQGNGKVAKVSMTDLGMKLQTSTTLDELKAAGAIVAAQRTAGHITPQQREDLSAVYEKRQAEIKAGKPDTITGVAANSNAEAGA